MTLFVERLKRSHIKITPSFDKPKDTPVHLVSVDHVAHSRD
jgi:hypothetical protein